MSEKSAPSYQEQWMIGSNLNNDEEDEYDQEYHEGKGLFIYYVISDGGGSSQFITILHGGGLPRPPNCIT